MDLRICLITLVATSVAASPAAAQTMTPPAPSAPAQPARPAKDPSEIICEKQEELGSRLASTKVCHTRAEWADLRHQDRQMIDKAQTNLGMQGK